MITYWKFLLHEGTHPGERYCLAKAIYGHGNRVCKALGGELTTGEARQRLGLTYIG